MANRQYRPWNPYQAVLFPPAMRDALDEGHMVFRLMDVVESLDISSVTTRMDERDPRGNRPYHPRMMLALLMYAYCSGLYSSRKIAAATYEMIPFRVLTGDEHPHFTVINEFRLTHLEAFVDLFVKVLELCGRAGLLNLEHVSLDGSKVDANASKHKAMSSGRMETEVRRLEREIRGLTEKAEKIDAYLAVGRTKHGQTRDDDKPRQETEAERAMRDKLASDSGRQIYARRKVIVEPVFGQVKEARGFRRFSLRGKDRAGREWTLVCLCHNLLKLLGVDLNAASTACQPAAQEG